MKGNTKQKQKNIKRVLSEIRLRGPISKRELQSITGFSWGSISSITSELEALGYIAFSGKQDTSLGRKPEEFDININDNYIIGIDFNYVGVLIVLCDLRGRQVKRYFEAIVKKTKECALETLYNLVEKILNENRRKNISHIALAVQGDVDSEQGISVKNGAIKDWNNVPLKDMIESRFGKKTILLHDPDCLIYSEKFFGHLRDADIKNAILVRIDHGVGLAAMLNEKVYIGNGRQTCEIGWTVVPYENRWGYFQGFLGEEAVCREYEKRTSNSLSFNAVVALARSGDEISKEIFTNIGKAIGFAVSNVSAILNPQKIILFGEFCRYADLFIDTAGQTLKKLSISTAPEIVQSNLDMDAAAVGAALFAADDLIKELNFTD